MQIDRTEFSSADSESSGSSGTGENSEGSKYEVAAYVNDLTRNLKDMAQTADLKFLAYLLDMAYIESSEILIKRSSQQSQNGDS